MLVQWFTWLFCKKIYKVSVIDFKNFLLPKMPAFELLTNGILVFGLLMQKMIKRVVHTRCHCPFFSSEKKMMESLRVNFAENKKRRAFTI